ncbi:MAG: tetratricopeptide repeat protein [Chitinispirillaceae bacterium]
MLKTKNSYMFKPFCAALFILWASLPLCADGLPGEYLLSQRWRTLFSTISPLNNPANLAEQNYSSFRGVATLSADDVANLWELGLVMPLGLYHTAGLTWVCENGRPIESGEFEGDRFVFSDEQKNNVNSQYMFSYALHLWRGLVAGANFNLLTQSNFGEDMDYNIGLDLGLSYRLLYHQFWGTHSLGVMYRNLPVPQMDGLNRVEYSPLFKAAYYASFFHKTLEFDVQFNVKDFTADPQEFLQENREYEWDVLVGASYWFLKYAGIKGYVEIDKRRSVESFGLAGAFNIPYVNKGKDLAFTYQYRNDMESDLMGTHSVYLKTDFGKHREEIHAKRIGRQASISANNLYNKAMKLYYKERYWDAHFIFGRILTEFPEFYKNDLVLYHAGSCLEELDMREQAIRAYQSTKERFPLSNIVQNADLGLMRIYYRQQHVSKVRNQYVELNKPGVNDSIRMHGSYLLGQARMMTGEFRSAVYEFDMIQADHPDYILAQLSKASCHASLDSGMEMIIGSLENCINTEVTTPAQKQAYNRACLLMGYAFYEEGALAKAVTALRMVDKNSVYHDEAQLGLGWTAIKARQWNDCIKAGKHLQNSQTDFVLQAEGALVESYGQMLQKRYDKVIEILTPALERVNEYSTVSHDSMQSEMDSYNMNRLQYGELSTEVVRLARRAGMVDDRSVEHLRKKCADVREQIEAYYSFEDKYNRSLFFARNLSSIREDMEYALVKAHKLTNSSDLLKSNEKMNDREQKLDEEIRRLEREAEKVSEKEGVYE